MPQKIFQLITFNLYIFFFDKEMDFDNTKAVIFSTVSKSDPHKASKELQLKYWCNAFSHLFNQAVQERLPFILDIFSDLECWQETNTIHRVRLNRRMIAKNLTHSHSKAGRINPLSDFERYQIACWCCLEEDIPVLFERIKQNNKVTSDDTAALRSLVKTLSTSHCSEPMIGFWSHIVGGFASELKLEGMHLYEYGLYYSLFMYKQHVEAMEFFLNKIRSLPENELSSAKKHEILINTALRASKTPVGTYPEIFDFCFSQLTPDDYPMFLLKDSESTRDFNSLDVLLEFCRFDELRKLLEMIGPNDFSEKGYRDLFVSLKVQRYSDYFVDEAVNLFMFVWRKEGFDRHRNYVIKAEMTASDRKGELLIPYVETNCMEPVWAIFDEATPDKIITFMKSEEAAYIRSLLEKRNDLYALNKFLSYAHPTRGCNAERSSDMEVDMEVIHEIKRLKKE